jgi:predicted polyphosphate/ATP-dependent NAD kinase
MKRRTPIPGTTVGIMANPASGRDVRRLVAHGSVFSLAEKCNMIIRLLAALGSTGVERALIAPDRSGITERLRRATDIGALDELSTQAAFLDIPVEDGPNDTVRAIERMVALGVGAIVVLGGDGTQRLAARACGETPILALSTGTNNVFPQVREATIAGLAAGLVTTGLVTTREGVERNKTLWVELSSGRREMAVVDVSICSDVWVGARAVWHPESISQIFVAFAEADAIGLSSIAGLLRPVSRTEALGLRVDLAPLETARAILHAPIAPGLLAPVGIAAVSELRLGERQAVRLAQGTIAIDGERELAFSAGDQVTVRLDQQGPFTIDVDKTMAAAVRKGLFLAEGEIRLEKKGVIHEIGQIGATASISDDEGHPGVRRADSPRICDWRDTRVRSSLCR